MVLGDVNGDGLIDLFMVNQGRANHLYANNGSGTFTWVMAGDIVNDVANSKDAVMGDFNSDGFLDVLVVNNGNEANQLYLSNPGFEFTAMASGDIVSESFDATAAVFGDYNNDGYPDLYVGNYHGPNRLHTNDGAGGYTTIEGSGALYARDGHYIRGAAWGDYDVRVHLLSECLALDEADRLLVRPSRLLAGGRLPRSLPRKHGQYS